MKMRKRKWFIPVVVASVLLIGGITGGLVLAANNSSSNTTAGNQTQGTDRYQALLDRVCAIYEEKTGVAIDSGQLKAALEQARSEMQDEALQSRLEKLVNEGKITQAEADQYLQWWQSRPNIGLPGLGGQGRFFGPRGGPWCSSNASAEAGG
jgi:C4-dicarboxylate-specific signal transduction histidine kinase